MLDYHGVIFGGGAWRCCLSFEALFTPAAFRQSVRKEEQGRQKKKKAVVIVPLHAALRKSYLSLRAADQEPGPIGIFFLHRPFKNTDQDG